MQKLCNHNVSYGKIPSAWGAAQKLQNNYIMGELLTEGYCCEYFWRHEIIFAFYTIRQQWDGASIWRQGPFYFT